MYRAGKLSGQARRTQSVSTPGRSYPALIPEVRGREVRKFERLCPRSLPLILRASRCRRRCVPRGFPDPDPLCFPAPRSRALRAIAYGSGSGTRQVEQTRRVHSGGASGTGRLWSVLVTEARGRRAVCLTRTLEHVGHEARLALGIQGALRTGAWVLCLQGVPLIPMRLGHC